MTDKIKTPQRFGFVTVIGEPNAGKSTLINNLVGTKVSIVSPKVQTTRTRVLGIAIEPTHNAQIVFVDTPGIFDLPNNKGGKADGAGRMERAIVSSAWEGIAETENIILLVDASKLIRNGKVVPQIKGPTVGILERLQHEKGKRCVLVLNKIDKVKREALLILAQQLNDIHNFEATFMISALKGHGVSDILSFLAKEMPQESWHFPEDQVSDMPMRLLAAEVTREKLFKMMHQELPYHLTVETEEWEPFKDGSIKIYQTIFIAREAHKKIILGRGGEMIKKIGQMARGDLEEMMECAVHLKLFVKVREGWLDEEEHYSLWGLDPNA